MDALTRPSRASLACLQRTSGHGALAVGSNGSTTRIVDIRQAGAAKIRFPRRQGSALEAVLINTAGGLTGGDELDWSIEVEQGASLAVTTQACEKLYRSEEGSARISSNARIAPNASLFWFPQETIAFHQSRMRRTLDFELENGASLVLLEPLLIGRPAYGEHAPTIEFRDSWRVRSTGKLVHSEELRIRNIETRWLDTASGTNGNRAMASILVVGPILNSVGADLESCTKSISASKDHAIAYSSKLTINGCEKMIVRILARDNYAMRPGLEQIVGSIAQAGSVPTLWKQ